MAPVGIQLATGGGRSFAVNPTPTTERNALERDYGMLIDINEDLDRQLVSYQASKDTPFARWFRYKEAFSEQMVSYILSRLTAKPGCLLDPFAGSGAALFASRDMGWRAIGIELLPVGIFAIKSRLAAENVSPRKLQDVIGRVKQGEWKDFIGGPPSFEHVRITSGAYPPATEQQLHAFLAFCKSRIRDINVRTVCRFAAYSILESISYTRKDGQYLRWDSRSGRRYGRKEFLKGPIVPFKTALVKQLERICEDLNATQGDLFKEDDRFDTSQSKLDITLYEDSCLTRLPKLDGSVVDFILTSPPYCNRYDYTRTYALELVFLGLGEERIRELRQAMLSCTVENRPKVEQLEALYRTSGRSHIFRHALEAFDAQKALHEVLDILDALHGERKLNNNAIPRMVRNYFLEMSLVIHECATVMKPGAWFVMVNDNVSYAGEPIPVDLILSEFARSAGLDIERVWRLSKGKGNSSQQMGAHGRKELRKCIYLWRRPKAKSSRK